MHILNLDTAATETNLDSLRADADALTPTSLPQLPAAGPLAGLATAITNAVAAANDQAVLLTDEARRVADNMSVFSDKASLIDVSTAHSFKALHP
ncbi:hypothetical protein SAMN05444817_105133 [Corynebacterium appendicis CIP 107643]|uniref:Excreted virulence factor EspC, type VII ESX diderm n=1 Tax=Corynebacterium appendicis CIP 107643 TaxID=1161099 RepID=A0A1N7JBQ3_9CORY|nr:hypothetical protein [Corynebacterium appendicis]MCT1684187.1 hypothetical protein [Corynebacterium appendicis]MDK8625728.1 hypothetical protein [Corynebacterium appendicis]WJY60370.1 hypothetical protein CAPP_02135 [Corynebacterium appendicis CIP 107643]SIS46717.1 hypothetical protein SAMN05444817_105133 [Corynebacterium appendicis CIP 107643]